VPEATAPQVGQVVEHHFLWFDEAAAGRTEGRKPRPCLVVAIELPAGSIAPRVSVLPITSQTPRPGSTSIRVPDALKTRMGIDPVRDAWVVLDDANSFAWPGFDLVPQTNGTYVRGTVTASFFVQVRDTVVALRARNRPRRVDRDQ
jgi:hypothetical protein